MEQNFAIKWSLALLIIMIIGFGNANAQAALGYDSVSVTTNEDIYNLVNKVFRFPWSKVYEKKPHRHLFFSLRFTIDSDGLISSIQGSEEMDLNVFGKSIEKMKKELPIDLFSKTQIKNAHVLFPVFIFINPAGDSLKRHKPNEKDDETPPVFDKTFSKSIQNIWNYHEGSTSSNNSVIFKPIIYVLEPGFPDTFIPNEEKKDYLSLPNQ